MSPTKEQIEAAAKAVEGELDVVEMIDASPTSIRKLRSKRIAAAALSAAEAVRFRETFPSDGNEEARWIEDMENSCPHCGGSGHKDDVSAAEAQEVKPDDVRKWFHYPIIMPITSDGKGPATVGKDAAKITFEVWDQLYNSHGSFGNLPDAINEAMRLNAGATP